jgi:hypothetical protein
VVIIGHCLVNIFTLYKGENMITITIILNPETEDRIYTELCDKMERQGVLRACGSCDDKWVMGKWDSEEDYLAWYLATVCRQGVNYET